MKYFFLIFCLIFSTILSFAQSPQGITFQAVARDPAGNAAKLRQISVIDRILSGSSNGTVIWEERHELTTNAEGVFTIIIGKGTKLSGSATTFDDIKWDQGLVFFNLKVAVAPSLPSPSWTADANFIDMGTSQFWSVPYALSAGTTSGITGKEDVSNKSTSSTLGRSDVLYPSQNAVKTYVDATVSSGAPDADNTIKGKLRLAGDLGGTADLPRVPALALKAPINNPTFTGTVSGITKAMVGLGNVNNTSDSNKVISILTKAALALKAPLASPTFTGTPTLPSGTIATTQSAGNNSTALATTAYVDAAVTSGSVADATTISLGKIQLAGDLGGTASSPTVPGLISKAPLASPTFTGTPTLPSGTIAVTQTAGNNTTAVATTSYVDGAISTLSTSAQDALNLKAPLASPTFTGTPTLPTGTIATTQSGGDNSTALATTAYVDAAVTSGSVADATTSSLGKIQLAGDLGGTASSPTVPGLAVKAPLESPTFTGTVSGITATMVGLGNVDNTSDVNKTISALTQAALDLKAPLASPTFTGTVSGITATMVGLGNVDNTSDANKAISALTQAALDLKAPLASPTFTGTVNGITKAMVGLGNVDNTSDAGKAISTLTQAALDLKSPLASPTFTGTVNGVDAIFSGSVDAAAFNVTSDKRLKTDIKPLSNGVEAIMKLNPVTYKKKATLSSQDYLIKENGFIAQELQKVMPILVQEGTDANKILTVNYISIIPVLTKAIQEQQKQIADQQKQINDLKVLVEKLINKK